MTYQINKPKSGGTIFTCAFCSHSVNTLDFDSEVGNRRTQAATVINQHVEKSHSRTSSSAMALHLSSEPQSVEADRPSLPIHVSSGYSNTQDGRVMEDKKDGALASVRMELSSTTQDSTLTQPSVLEPKQKD